MLRFIGRRLLVAIPTLFLVVTLAFFMMRAAPGSPFDMDRKLSPEIERNVMAKYGMNKPLGAQYVDYLVGVTRGDLGPSLKYKDKSVLQILKEIQQQSGNTVLLVTHDMAVHANVADRVMIMYAGRIMEEAATETIFQAPRHPYTQHLISSLPSIGERRQRAALPGSPPNLSDPPEGCRFHLRCPVAIDICKTVVPAMRLLPDRHRVACHLVEGPTETPQEQPEATMTESGAAVTTQEVR